MAFKKFYSLRCFRNTRILKNKRTLQLFMMVAKKLFALADYKKQPDSAFLLANRNRDCSDIVSIENSRTSE